MKFFTDLSVKNDPLKTFYEVKNSHLGVQSNPFDGNV